MRTWWRRARSADSQLLWASGIAAALLFGVLAAGIWQFWQLQQSLDRQAVLTQTAYAEHDRLLQMVNEETGVRGFVATGNPLYLQIYYGSQQQLRRDQAAVSQTQAAIPRLERSVGLSIAASARVQRYFEREIVLMRAHRRAAALAQLSFGKQLFDRLRDVDAAVQNAADRELQNQRTHTRLLARIGFSSAIALCGVLALWVAAVALLARRARMYRLSSLRDSLTGLQNRRGAIAAIEAQLNGGELRSFGLVFIDLDGFKKINDVYGHATGDALLRGVASRLQSELRAGDAVCRLGGDEFVCIVAPPASSEEVSSVARRLCRAVTRPYEIEGDAYVIGCSVGTCMYPKHGKTAEALLARADRAMYEAKAAGGGVREAAAR